MGRALYVLSKEVGLVVGGFGVTVAAGRWNLVRERHQEWIFPCHSVNPSRTN